jgi:uncharacterized protein
VPFRPPSATACWQHLEARTGFEVAYFQSVADGWRIEGSTAAVEDTQTWVVTYSIQLDSAWATRSARITARTTRGLQQIQLESDGAGHWQIDGGAARHLDGCMDIDLESSAMTNTLPVHRLHLPAGATADAPAAYVRAANLIVERLEQTYARIAGEAAQEEYDYAAPAFGFTARLVYDESGLVLSYPGIAVRVG